MSTSVIDTIRQMLAEWNAASAAQREAALQAAAAMAAAADRRLQNVREV